MSNMKMDTQGMSMPIDPNDPEYKKKSKESKQQEYKPAIIKPRRLFTETYVKELKILLNEVLDEREGRMNYTSYFDTEQFKHPVGEEEPEYKPTKKKVNYNPSYYQ